MNGIEIVLARQMVIYALLRRRQRRYQPKSGYKASLVKESPARHQLGGAFSFWKFDWLVQLSIMGDDEKIDFLLLWLGALVLVVADICTFYE